MKRDYKKRGNSSIEIVLSLVMFSVLAVIVLRLFTGLVNLQKDIFIREMAQSIFHNTNEVFYSYDDVDDIVNDSFFYDYHFTLHDDIYFCSKVYKVDGVEFQHTVNLQLVDEKSFVEFLKLDKRDFDDNIAKVTRRYTNNLYKLENSIITNNNELLSSYSYVNLVKKSPIVTTTTKSLKEEVLDDE